LEGCNAAGQYKDKAALVECPVETDRAEYQAVKACPTLPSPRARDFRVPQRQAALAHPAGPADKDRAVDLLDQVQADMARAMAAIFPERADKAARAVSQDKALQAVLADKAVQVDSPIKGAQADLPGKVVRAGFLDRALRAGLAGKVLLAESPVRVAETQAGS
jgi:hypothetical protein